MTVMYKKKKIVCAISIVFFVIDVSKNVPVWAKLASAFFANNWMEPLCAWK